MNDKEIIVVTGIAVTGEHGFEAHCPELDLRDCGDDLEEALERLGNTVTMNLYVLAREGRLESVLHDRKIEVRSRAPESVTVNVSPEETVQLYVRTLPTREE